MRDALTMREALAGARHIRDGHGPQSAEAVYLVERLFSAEEPPQHPGLPAATGPVEVDGRAFWVIHPEAGLSLEQVLEEEGPAPERAVERVTVLTEALLLLHERGLMPADFYRQIGWNGEQLVLAYPDAWLQERPQPSFPQVAEQPPAEAAVITLAAALHGCLTGKVATRPPYVFLPPSRFALVPAALDNLVAAGLNGQLSLADWSDRLRRLNRELLAARVLPPPHMDGPAEPAASAPARSGGHAARILDWLLWLVCLVAGVAVLLNWT